ncbi:unnamed protein product [Meloidogyne enterolobii]|uniref:Uncharacterized protein n=1 Tax=Meloidogyne enterolobii TaxID=390850 RepID=A0ACB0Z4H8_MELEN
MLISKSFDYILVSQIPIYIFKTTIFLDIYVNPSILLFQRKPTDISFYPRNHSIL